MSSRVAARLRLLSFSLLLFILSACGDGGGFEISAVEKTRALQRTALLSVGDNQNVTPVGVVEPSPTPCPTCMTPSPTPACSPTPTPPTMTPTPSPPMTTPTPTPTPAGSGLIGADFVCSNRLTQAARGMNLKTAQSVAVVLKKDNGGQAVCTIESPTIKTHLLNEKKVDVALVMKTCLERGDIAEGQKYLVDLIGKRDGKRRTLLFQSGFLLLSIAKSEITAFSNIANGRKVPLATPLKDVALGVVADVNGANTTVRCDRRASPLVVQLGDGDLEPRPIELTAPLDGISFDILGAKANHVPKQISWLAPGAARDHLFLVKPDRWGAVRGIDQMFGDNTTGPDGKFAANGYEALRKFDTNRDGYISKADPVFKDLRLWRDEDGDGDARPSELFTLDELAVEVIDLAYDNSYVERDRWGNETRMKSVVKTRDGRLHLIFDIWFRYL